MEHGQHEPTRKGMAVDQGDGWIGIPLFSPISVLCFQDKEKKMSDLREESPIKLVEILLKESLRVQRLLKVQPIAVKFWNPTGRDDNPGRVTMLDNIKREQKRVDERRREPVVRLRGESEEVDVFHVGRLRLAADKSAAREGDGEKFLHFDSVSMSHIIESVSWATWYMYTDGAYL